MTGEQTYYDGDALAVVDIIVKRMTLRQPFKATFTPLGDHPHYWVLMIERVKQE